MTDRDGLDEGVIAAIRAREFAAVAGAGYLNAASLGPMPACALRAAATYNAKRAAVHRMSGADFEPTLAACRAAAARLVGAAPEEIALGGNTSFGINLAAAALPTRGRRTIVVSDREFPANVYPWLARERDGYRLDVVPTTADGVPDEARLLERLDRGDVGVFAISSVQFATGWRADLATLGAFCRERGIRFVIDAIQSVGHLPFDVRAVHADVVAVGGHKWLCGPFGAGFAYVRRELIERIEPAVVGWAAVGASARLEAVLDYRLDFLGDARRFETGTLAIQDLAALTASVELLLEVGIERIERHVLGLLDPLVAWAARHPSVDWHSDVRAGRRSGIFCFRPPDPADAVAALARAGVVASFREGAVRIAPHLYNTPSEIARMIEVVDSLETP